MIKPLTNADLYKQVHVDLLGSKEPSSKDKSLSDIEDKDEKIKILEQRVMYWKNMYMTEKSKNNMNKG